MEVNNNTQCLRVVIVEDDPDIRQALRYIIKLEGYDVLEAANGNEALQILKSISKPCLILLDLMMPVMNGWEFMDALNGSHILATVPVVIVSAFSDKARSIKAQGFLKKPVDLESLRKILKQYCTKTT